MRLPWAELTGDRPRPAFAIFNFAFNDIIKMSRRSCSCSVCLSVAAVPPVLQGYKKPCFRFGKQGVKIVLVWFFYLLASSLSALASGLFPEYAEDRPK